MFSIYSGESCFLSVDEKACSSLYDKGGEGDTVVVCGSRGEVGNSNVDQNIFQFVGTGASKFDSDFERQKSNVWSMIALESSDQLRQRMAWALSQILAISPSQVSFPYFFPSILGVDITKGSQFPIMLKIEEEDTTEIYLNYYDIFVRNAFGNYFDVLKEVAYSPMMAEMLSFLESKSTSFVLKETGNKAFPDENFAREIMQLFTIGVHKLNDDGTLMLNSDGNPILTYQNSDIQNFARAWTGFTRPMRRASIEGFDWDDNRIDPMSITGPW